MAKKVKKDYTRYKLLAIDGVIVAAAFMLVLMFTGYLKERLVASQAEETYTEVAQKVVEKNHTAINFSVVQAHGSTATSWLYIPGTKIDYPLVQGNDNDYYLDRDAYGNPSQAGAIFINFANSPDLSDAKTVIFGHNMTNGSMFTDLHKYSKEEYGRTHQNAYVYMDNGEVRHYRVLSYIYTEPLDPDVYVVSPMDTPDEVAAALTGRAAIVFNEYSGGNIICLSTCSMHKYRTVVTFEYIDNAKPIVGSVNKEEAEEKAKAAEKEKKAREESKAKEEAEEEKESSSDSSQSKGKVLFEKIDVSNDVSD